MVGSGTSRLAASAAAASTSAGEPVIARVRPTGVTRTPGNWRESAAAAALGDVLESGTTTVLFAGGAAGAPATSAAITRRISLTCDGDPATITAFAAGSASIEAWG